MAAAQPRKEVQAKKNRRRTAEGLGLHSFSTLLQVLGTRCRHQCGLQGDANGPTAERLTEPGASQQGALEMGRAFPVQDNSRSS